MCVVVVVTRLAEQGLAISSGKIEQGDVILSINDEECGSAEIEIILALLRDSGGWVALPRRPGLADSFVSGIASSC